jgi:hypothetical protein
MRTNHHSRLTITYLSVQFKVVELTRVKFGDINGFILSFKFRKQRSLRLFIMTAVMACNNTKIFYHYTPSWQLRHNYTVFNLEP